MHYTCQYLALRSCPILPVHGSWNTTRGFSAIYSSQHAWKTLKIAFEQLEGAHLNNEMTLKRVCVFVLRQAGKQCKRFEDQMRTVSLYSQVQP